MTDFCAHSFWGSAGWLCASRKEKWSLPTEGEMVSAAESSFYVRKHTRKRTN